jgi:hypothetical protein
MVRGSMVVSPWKGTLKGIWVPRSRADRALAAAPVPGRTLASPHAPFSGHRAAGIRPARRRRARTARCAAAGLPLRGRPPEGRQRGDQRDHPQHLVPGDADRRCEDHREWRRTRESATDRSGGCPADGDHHRAQGPAGLCHAAGQRPDQHRLRPCRRSPAGTRLSETAAVTHPAIRPGPVSQLRQKVRNSICVTQSGVSEMACQERPV